MDNLITLIGRLHPLVVHLPIGFLVVAICFHALVWSGRYPVLKEALPLLWLMSFGSAVVASLAGYLLSWSGGYEEQALNLHMWLGLGLAFFSGVVYVLLRKGVSPRLQMPGVLGVALLLMATGHFGGNLTHGEEYLTQPLYAMLGQAPERPSRAPITDVEQAVVFTDLIEPVLEQKCWQCHSATKQKGKLRLDSKDLLLKGGKHGAVVEAGNAEESSLYTRLVLPEEDEDRMPPKGKLQLTEGEIKLIRWWLTAGKADFTKKVAEVPKDEEVKTVLASFGSGGGREEGPTNATASEIPATAVARANPAAIAALEALGVSFTPLTPNHTFLAANLVNAKEFSDAQVDLLLKLQDQLVWLDLSETKITNKALPKVAQLKNLTRLRLDNTAVTDAGVAHLKNLKALRYLNLYGTKVTDQSLESLKALPHLEALYLWQTQVTPQGVAALREARGEGLEVNVGIEPENTEAL